MCMKVELLMDFQVYRYYVDEFTNIQHGILVKLHSIVATYHGYSLELELLITIA